MSDMQRELAAVRVMQGLGNELTKLVNKHGSALSEADKTQLAFVSVAMLAEIVFMGDYIVLLPQYAFEARAEREAAARNQLQ